MKSARFLVAAVAVVAASVVGAPSAAAQEAPTVSADSSLEAKVRDVAATLRCPVCENLSIQDSPSKLAQDMKQVVRERLAAGETPDQVRRYFVSRYGEWVLLKPKASGINLSVWLLPLLALAGGGALVWLAVRRWVRQGQTESRDGAGAAAPPADLRARRHALQESLAELDAEFAAGQLTEADRAVLKQRDQAELAHVNEALKQLRKETPHATEAAPAAEPTAPRSARRWPARLGWAGGLAVFGVVVVLSLRGSLAPRPEGGSITGQQFAASAPGADGGVALQETGPLDSLRITELEARVRADSSDVTALVELGHLYLAQGEPEKAVVVDTMAVRLQPDAEGTAGAFADLAMILWGLGETDAAFKSLDKALFLHPDLPEALLYRGIILFAGVHDMHRAAETFERYLVVAPPDANTGRVRAMLDAARQAADSQSR
jgi:cytochrome c-type biogenesis protein CcmH